MYWDTILETIKIVGGFLGLFSAIFSVWYREYIKTKFKNQLQESQNEFTSELDRQQKKFLLDLETKKMGFDIIRTTQIEINKNKLLFYENLISVLHKSFRNLVRYEFDKSKITKVNIDLITDLFVKKSFYFSDVKIEITFFEIMDYFSLINNYILERKDIPEKELNKFKDMSNKLKTQMMDELTKEEIL